jgi:hypothetical protein
LDADRATLSFFFAVQAMRTPSAAAQVRSVANIALQTVAGSEFSDKAQFAQLYRAQFGDRASDEEIEAFRIETIQAVREGRVTVEGTTAALATGIRHAADQSVLIFDLDWTLLRCSEAFVTSDRAVAMHDPAPPYPWSAQGLLSSLQAETTIPLDAGSCLVLRPLGRGTGEQEISPRDARLLNLRTYGWAERHIYGPSQEAVVAVHRYAKLRPDRVVGPRPQHHVVLIDPDPDDDSFANENQARGWPARLRFDGVDHDYVVIPHEGADPELQARVDRVVEERGRRALGVGEEAEGRLRTRLIHPLDLD